MTYKSNLHLVIILLLTFVCNISAQGPKYSMQVRADTLKNTIFVSTEIKNPSDFIKKRDTIWFSLPANTYSNTNNTFTDDQLKWGNSDFYFRKLAQLSSISNFKITDGNREIQYFFKDELKESVGVISEKLNTINISYTLRLPALIDGLGYDKGNIWLRNFYPRLSFSSAQADTKDSGQFSPDKVSGSDYDLSITPTTGYKIISNGDISSHSDTAHITGSKLKDLSLILLKNYKKIITGTFKSGSNDIPYTLVFLDKFHPKKWKNTSEIINQTSNAIEKYFGNFPYHTLTLMVTNNCAACFLSSGLALTKDADENLTPLHFLVQKLSAMSVEGIFNINAIQNKWFYEGLSAHYIQKIMKDFADTSSNYFEDKYSNKGKIKLFEYRKIRKLKPLSSPEYLLDQNQIIVNRKYFSVAFFQFIESLVGKNIFDQTLRSFAGTNLPLNIPTLVSALEQNSGLPLNVTLEKYLSSEATTDYSIENIVVSDTSLEVIIINNDTLILPFTLTVVLDNGHTKDYPVAGFIGKKQIRTDNYKINDIEKITIDKAGLLPEINTTNNQYFPNKLQKRGPIKPAFLFKANRKRERLLYMTAFPLYNDNDRLMAGVTFTNATNNDTKPLTVSISPMYSFKNDKLLGQAWISYDKYVTGHKTERIRFRAGIKTFDFNTNKSNNYRQRYIRIDPSIGIYFRHQPATGIESSLTLKAFFIAEQYPVYENNGLYKGLSSTFSNIYRLDYKFNLTSTLSTSIVHLSAEQQTNESQNYIKLTGILDQRYMYASEKNLNLRLFASGFIQNTRRESVSYQNVFTKGSIALIQQGFNDYTYDEYYFARQNQSGLHNRQVSQEFGGGFKTPVGSAYGIGMSNNFAAALNVSADFPFFQRWLPLRFYFDIGTYSTFAKNKFINNVIYNGGLSVYWRDAITVHVPLFFSQELGNIYTGEHKNFLSGISFSLNLHKVRVWH